MDTFRRLAEWTAEACGSPVAVGAAFASIVLWLAFGPLFGWSDTYQLIINTATTVVTFLMVFLIQAASNRQGRAMQLKMDELLVAIRDADNAVVGAERQTDEQIAALEESIEAKAT